MSLTSFILLITVLILLLFLIRRWANGNMISNKKDLTGKLIVITGASDGIGLETAKDLLSSNARVIFACRNKTKTETVIKNLPEKFQKNAFFVQMDLESFKSIENCAKEIKTKYEKIDILINNAGMGIAEINKTEDGYINIFQVNYLGNILLTLLLLEHFNEKESKIITVSSMAYKNSQLTYGDSKFLNCYDLKCNYLKMRNKIILYADTKLLINYFTQYLAELTDKKYPYLKVVCLHPGVILTNILKFSNIIKKIIFYLTVRLILLLFTKDVVHGAQNTLFLCYSDNKELVNGSYYRDMKIENYTAKGKDEKLKNEMVNETLNILKSKYKELEYLPLSVQN
jgi:retinol dehydrogenase-13